MDEKQKFKIAQAITGTFMWTYKDGDNIVFNFEIAWELYKSKNNTLTNHKKSLYNKPIMLTLVAIIECILDNFVTRVSGHVRDTVPNITPQIINDFKTKKRDKLEHFIAVAKKYNLFDSDTTFYNEMTFLREARNRFHIQNNQGKLANDEYDVFTDDNLARAEAVFEHILSSMMTKYYRGPSPTVTYGDVELPWKIGV